MYCTLDQDSLFSCNKVNRGNQEVTYMVHQGSDSFLAIRFVDGRVCMSNKRSNTIHRLYIKVTAF
jgi:hypothetical protein